MTIAQAVLVVAMAILLLALVVGRAIRFGMNGPQPDMEPCPICESEDAFPEFAEFTGRVHDNDDLRRQQLERLAAMWETRH